MRYLDYLGSYVDVPLSFVRINGDRINGLFHLFIYMGYIEVIKL